MFLRKLFTVVLLSLLFLQPALSAQNKFREPPADQSLWLKQFTVLLAADADAKKSIQVIEKTIAKDFKKMPVGTFKKYQPSSVSTFLPMLESTKQKRSSSDAESAREKLGRYLIVNYPDELDIERIFTELKADPNVLYVAIVKSMPLAVSAAPPSPGGGASTNAVITENKTWGYDKMRAGSAANYIHGHALIGVLDLGLDMSHEEFIDYSGTTWKGGNYHPHLSFSISSNATPNGGNGNPFTATAGLGGSVDAYNLVQFPADADCDTNNDGIVGMVIVGHGSHVAGIIGQTQLTRLV